MNHSLLRIGLLIAAIGLASPAVGDDAAAPTKPESAGKARDYVRYLGDDKRGRLETVIVTMKKDDITLELVGAVHVADPEYYKALTELFTGYEELLFELVDGQRLKEEFEGAPADKIKKTKAPAPRPESEPTAKSTPPPEARVATPERASTEPAPKADTEPDEHADEAKDKSPAIRFIGAMMQGVGSYFRFQYQTEGIDYSTKNFVHADVSMDEFLRLQEDKGESFLGLIQKAIEAQLEIGTHREAEPKGSQLLLALLGDSSGLKVAMARQLAVADDLVAAMEKGDGSVIISDRNKKALEVLDRQVAAGRKKLGLFYGAAHLGDLEARLEKKGYQRTGERWMTAWDIKPRVDTRAKPAAPAE
jgi:hypothetical protein